MSSYSLDSLEKCSTNNSRAVRKKKTQQTSSNLEIAEKFKDKEDFAAANNSIQVCEKRERLPSTGRPAVTKKLNVPRGRSCSLSSSEFRHDSWSLTGKRAADVAEFMKADKKLGNVQPSGITDSRSKKPVSYLEFYHRRFGAGGSKGHHCMCVPLGSNVSTGDVGAEKRGASNSDSGSALLVPRVEDFHHPELQLIESREPSESRSCEALDSFVTKGREFEASSRDDFTVGCFSNGGQEINRQTRQVSYKPYGIEDYKNLSVPSADRSLGPDRLEMERKGEWLMRRRTYGDSVSTLNRQRILRRAEKLKNSRRSDSEKASILDGLASMGSKHGGPASKELLQRDTSIVASSLSGSEGRKNFPKKCRSVSNDAGKPSPSIAKKVSAFNSSKSVTKARALSRVYSNLYETSSDTLDDESMTLNKLQQRHLADKNMVDRLFKRGLYS